MLLASERRLEEEKKEKGKMGVNQHLLISFYIPGQVLKILGWIGHNPEALSPVGESLCRNDYEKLCWVS